MNNYFFIKYYYTCFNSTQLFQDLQLKIESKLEDKYKSKELKVYFQFIDTSDSSYYNDIVHIDHTFDLEQVEKEIISNTIDELIYFYDESDEETIDLIGDTLEKKHHLKHVIFQKIKNDDIILIDNN